MIHLKILGGIELRDDTEANLTRVLRQPKRFALLAYLVLARPRGFHRRETVMALFWPELSDARARAALRQALYTLRRELPEEILLNRGDGEIAVDGDLIACDVHAFERAVSEERPAVALDLYRGELLPGFHVHDASAELDQWLDTERARLAEMAAQAARSAVDGAEAAGDLAAAARYARRAAALAPLDEDAATREMELLHRAGDRGAALRAFEQFKRVLETELDVQPSPATLALGERLRQAPPARAGAPSRAGSGPEHPPGNSEPAPEGEEQPAGRRRLPGDGSTPSTNRSDDEAAATTRASRTPAAPFRRRRKRAALGAVFAIALLAALIPLGWLLTGPGSVPANSRVMIAPFAYSGSGESSYLSEGMVYLFSVALDGGGFRTVDPHALVRRTEGWDLSRYEPKAASELARRLEASFFVLGSVVEAEGRLQVSAYLYERGSEQPLARATATGPASGLLGLVDELAGELLTFRSGAPSRVTQLAAVTTASLPALKSYLTGERLLREGQFTEAIAAYQDAVQADSSFALAYYRMSQAASWAFRGDLSTRMAARAVAYSHRLPDHERRLLSAHQAYRRGEAPAALEALNELSVLYPDDPEVWYRLGEVRMHFGPLLGWKITEAREPFLRATALDPRYTEAYYHLTQIEAATGDTSEALRYARMALEAAPDGSRAPQLRVLQSVLGRGEPWSAQLRGLSGADDFTVLSSTYNAAVYGQRPDLARAMAKELVSGERPAEARAFGYVLLADLELALGRAAAAEENLKALERIDRRRAIEHRGLLATAPPSEIGSRDIRTLLLELQYAPTPSGMLESAGWPWQADPRHAELTRLYAWGLLAAMSGDSTELERLLTELDAAAPEAELAGDLAQDIRMAAGLEGASASGERKGPSFTVPLEAATLSPVLSRPARRYMEGRRLEAEGELREALLWYESLTQFSIHDLPWGIPAMLDRARVHEALGETEEALALYRRFNRLWDDAEESELRSAGRAALARLEGTKTQR